MIIPVILSGGSGTRLWPLSTPEKPKQFLSLVSERTLFQETLLRLHGIDDLADPIVVCNEAHRFLVAEQLREIGVSAHAIVLEPEGRNTAPAIGVAAAIAIAGAEASRDAKPHKVAPDADPVLLVLPADHVIADREAFQAAVGQAVASARSGKLATFGVVPTRPDTGYGYIEKGEASAQGFAVQRFVEKPDQSTADDYQASSRFLWNSGMFVFGAQQFLRELERTAPAIHSSCLSAVESAVKDSGFTRLGSAFLESPSDSIDYAVMEKTDRAAVIPLDAGWSDVGSWEALHDALEQDKSGNVMRGDSVSLDSRNCFALPGSRKVALVGLDDVIVIDSEDAVLVVRKDRSQDVKALLQKVTPELLK